MKRLGISLTLAASFATPPAPATAAQQAEPGREPSASVPGALGAEVPGGGRAPAADRAEAAGRRGPRPESPQDAARRAVPFPGGVNPGAVRAAQDPRLQPLLSSFRRTLHAELHLVRVTCNPTPGQRRALAAAGEAAIREAALECITEPHPDTHPVVARALANAFYGHLTAEQAARYREEVEGREAGYRRAAVGYLVSHLDRLLSLSIPQREELAASLAANWDDDWGVVISRPQLPVGPAPYIPDRLVEPILDERQRAIWKAMNVPTMRVNIVMPVEDGDDPFAAEADADAALPDGLEAPR